jgi:DnaK suppressor protein
MPLDIAHYKQLLLDKANDLLSDITRLTEEGRGAREAEVEDPIDRVTSSEGQAAAFQESTMEMQTLHEVRDALRRIDEGRYGRCEDCGREIERARLEAAPWARYCRADQEKHDAAKQNDELPD